jgi:hypothetical protein
MTILSKTSNLARSAHNKLEDYVTKVDADLQHLFNRFTNIFHVKQLQVGSDSNYTTIGSGGMVNLYGTAQGALKLRPTMGLTVAGRANEPTEVIRGANIGYSMYIWADAPTDRDQELHMKQYVPNRWNATEDPQIGCLVSTIGAETAGKKFKFVLSWATTLQGSGVDTVSATTSTAYSEITIPTGGALAYGAFDMWFTLNADDANNPITPGSMLQCILRRVAASSNEISGEVGVWDWVSHWRVNKMYGAWAVETNG